MFFTMCFYHNDYLTSIKTKGSSRIYVYISLYFSITDGKYDRCLIIEKSARIIMPETGRR